MIAETTQSWRSEVLEDYRRARRDGAETVIVYVLEFLPAWTVHMEKAPPLVPSCLPESSGPHIVRAGWVKSGERVWNYSSDRYGFEALYEMELLVDHPRTEAFFGQVAGEDGAVDE